MVFYRCRKDLRVLPFNPAIAGKKNERIDTVSRTTSDCFRFATAAVIKMIRAAKNDEGSQQSRSHVIELFMKLHSGNVQQSRYGLLAWLSCISKTRSSAADTRVWYCWCHFQSLLPFLCPIVKVADDMLQLRTVNLLRQSNSESSQRS